jgi:hypothetical protein
MKKVEGILESWSRLDPAYKKSKLSRGRALARLNYLHRKLAWAQDGGLSFDPLLLDEMRDLTRIVHVRQDPKTPAPIPAPKSQLLRDATKAQRDATIRMMVDEVVAKTRKGR